MSVFPKRLRLVQVQSRRFRASIVQQSLPLCRPSSRSTVPRCDQHGETCRNHQKTRELAEPLLSLLYQNSSPLVVASNEQREPASRKCAMFLILYAPEKLFYESCAQSPLPETASPSSQMADAEPIRETMVKKKEDKPRTVAGAKCITVPQRPPPAQ